MSLELRETSRRNGCSWCLLATMVAMSGCAGRPAPATPPPTEVGDDGSAPGAFASPFFPAGYEASFFTDYAAMRDCGLLDQLERVPMMSSYLDAVAACYGCSADDVDRVRTAITFRKPDDRSAFVMVSVAETARSTREPQPPSKFWEPAKVGDYQAFREGKGPTYPDVCFRPDDRTAVHGDGEYLTALVTGAKQAGGPRPELLPLLRGERVLFQYVSGRFGRRIDYFLAEYGFMLAGDPADPVDFLRLRIGLDENGAVEVSLLLRYQHGKAGLQACEQGVRTGLDKFLARSDLKQFHGLIESVTTMHRDRDLVIRAQLGQPRDAIRSVERAVMAAMAMQKAGR